MIYVGMLFSSFCWHTEDNYLYSINYLHTGKVCFAKKKKTHPSSRSCGTAFLLQAQTCLKKRCALIFRNFLKKFRIYCISSWRSSPRRFCYKPEFLSTPRFRYDIIIFAPHEVNTWQNEGQFVVTCPRSYHAGFNTGFNCAESVNFALEDWLPLGRKACSDYRLVYLSVKLLFLD